MPTSARAPEIGLPTFCDSICASSSACCSTRVASRRRSRARSVGVTRCHSGNAAQARATAASVSSTPASSSSAIGCSVAGLRTCTAADVIGLPGGERPRNRPGNVRDEGARGSGRRPGAGGEQRARASPGGSGRCGRTGSRGAAAVDRRRRPGRAVGGVITMIDAWTLQRLAGAFVTDAATASRSLLLDLETTTWSDEACSIFGLDAAAQPEIVDCDAEIGTTDAFGGAVPITGLAVDQQAALFAESCFAPGEAKCTYGTGAFILA